MQWKLVVVRKARRQLEGIRGTDLRRIRTSLHSLEHDPRRHGVERLRDSKTHKLRSGDWRILFEIDDASKTVTVSQILRRNEATYDDI